MKSYILLINILIIFFTDISVHTYHRLLEPERMRFGIPRYSLVWDNKTLKATDTFNGKDTIPVNISPDNKKLRIIDIGAENERIIYETAVFSSCSFETVVMLCGRSGTSDCIKVYSVSGNELKEQTGTMFPRLTIMSFLKQGANLTARQKFDFELTAMVSYILSPGANSITASLNCDYLRKLAEHNGENIGINRDLVNNIETCDMRFRFEMGRFVME